MTKIIEQETFYLSGVFQSTFHESNKTSVEFVRNYYEKFFFKVFFDKKLDGANITWIGMFHTKVVDESSF